MIRAIIFDVDGTLAETEELHRRAFNDTFRANGLDWNWSRDDYTRLLQTTGGKERMRAFVSGDLRQDPARYPTARLHRQKTDAYGRLMVDGALTLRPGIAALIGDAYARGIPMAIATTTNRPNVDRLIEATFQTAPERLFDAIAAGDEVSHKKPAPDVYDLALRRLGIAPDQVVALEDSLNGVRSAQAAGLRCVVSPGQYTAHETFPPDAIRLECFSEIDSVPRLNASVCDRAA